MTLRFAVLGPLRVADGEGEIDPGSPQTRAVLATLLAQANQVVGVDTLLEQVWGEAGPRTTAALHVTVSRLRKRLRPVPGPGSPIVTEAPGYRLQVARADLDALRFTDLLGAARRLAEEGRVQHARTELDTALALWRGEPYLGIRTEAVAAEAARLDARWLEAVELSAELDLALGRHADLVGRLAEVAAGHPLRERLQGALITALYRQGRQAEALELYERTRQLLAEELGVDPGPELQRLHTSVLRQDPALARVPAVAGPPAGAALRAVRRPAPSRRVPVVGRRAEQECASALLELALTEGASGLAVFGEAGIGKTRLAEEVAERAAQLGFDTAWGRCQDGGGAPAFWPWSQALGALAAARPPDELRAALSGRGAAASVLLDGSLAAGAPESGPPAAARVLLFDAVTALLTALAAVRPVCLVLEDLHWADADSLDLLDYLLSSAGEAPVTVVMTVRDPDDSASAGGPRVLALASRHGRTERVHLDGLAVPDVAEYTSLQLGARVDAAAAGRLHERTGGNPFFLAELVHLLVDERETRTSADAQVPASVQAVLERRFRHLAGSTRALLAAAAVIGRTVDVRLLAAVVGRAPADLADDLDAAVAVGALAEDAEHPGVYAFTHALVLESLLATTGAVRRGGLHLAVADVLERTLDPAEAAAALAFHHRGAGALGDPEKAAHFSLVAATNARRRAAPREAERHCRDALRVLRGRSGPRAAALEREAHRHLAGLLTMTLGYDTAGTALERRTGQEAEQGDERRSQLTGSVAVALASGDLPAAELLVSEMEGAADRWDDPTLRVAAWHARGQVLVLRGRLRAGLVEFTRVAELLDQRADEIEAASFIQDPRASAPAWQAISLSLLGDLAAGDAAAAAARSVAEAVDAPYTTAMIDYLEGWRSVLVDRPDAAVRCSSAALAGARQLRLPKLAVLAQHPLAWGLAHTGEVDEGLRVVTDAQDTLPRVAPGDMLSHLLLGTWAQVLARAGRDDEADAMAVRALAEGRRTGERIYQPELQLLRARIGRRRGGPPARTRELLLEGLRLAQEQDAVLFAARLRAELAELDG